MKKLASQRPLPQEQILLQELNHRVNNEFACAISAVSLVAARTENDEVKGALNAVAELLHRYADVHRALRLPEHDTLVDFRQSLLLLVIEARPTISWWHRRGRPSDQPVLPSGR